MTESNDQVELTEEQQKELLQKYDVESNTRNLTGLAAKIVFCILIIYKEQFT